MPDEPKSAPPPDESPAGISPPPQDPKKLTPEEQMALYEEALKETDWGHQPC